MHRCVLSVFAVFALALTAAVAAPAAGVYGPCCPLVKGQKPLALSGTALSGPRHVCETRSLNLSLNGETRTITALETQGSLLVPARLFTALGAALEWGGNRQLTLSLGARRVALQLGSHAATLSDGAETQMVSWPLCPRLVSDISFVPLRLTATALGLNLTIVDGVISLTPGAGAATAPESGPTKCPADRVEEALGVTTVRSPADSAFGVGAGLTQVKAEGLGARFGLKPGDVIIGANGRPVRCPKDLDQILRQAAAAPGDLHVLTVARGPEKLTLQLTPAP